MRPEAVTAKPGGRLRIAVNAADPQRRAELARLVAAAGHEVVTDEVLADAVLSDLEMPRTARPLVTLGVGDYDQAGALPRDAAPMQIDAAIRAAAAGLWIRPAADSFDGFGPERDLPAQSLLTPREVEVLSAISAGLSNKAIAQRLDISLHTVKFHVESLLHKLGARTRAEAVAKGLARRNVETLDI
jgi:DNA-binding NarL/FixJ family response regulator